MPYYNHATVDGPYSFFTYVLNNYNIRENIIAALGGNVVDPLEEFLTICLAYERTQPGTLKHFIKWFITGNSEIKRDMDSGDGVRIVTVHGSKGLQSRGVFLIDTVNTPKSDKTCYIPGCNGALPVWVWTARAVAEYSPEYSGLSAVSGRATIAESFRLLYVAMTRARDELYIYGFCKYKNAPELSWHNALWRVLHDAPGTVSSDDVIRVSNYDE